MIVISGALVLVALVLLVIGIVGPELAFVYASIAVSLVSLIFLVIGILQRRGETLPGELSAPAPATAVTVPADGATATLVNPVRPVRRAEPVVAEPQDDEDAFDEDDGLERGGTVLVVAGRPRYHVDGCRYLIGKDVEAVDVLDALEEGFTPCGVCKPDATLAALAALEEEDELDGEELPLQVPVEQDLEVEPEDDEAVEDEAELEDEVVDEPVPVVAARSGRGRTAAVPVVPAVPVRAVADEATVTSRRPAATTGTRTAAKTATRAATTAAVVDAPVPVPVPARAAKAPAPARAAKAVPVSKGTPATRATRTAPVVSTPIAAPPAAPVRAGSVVVIPDRGRFHRAECRYVRSVAGATTMSKSAATKQGYDACGVCKP